MSTTLCEVLPATDKNICQIADLNQYIGQLKAELSRTKHDLSDALKGAEHAKLYRRFLAHRDDIFDYVVDKAFDGDRQVKFTVDGGCHDEDFLPGVYTKNGLTMKLVASVYEVCEEA